MKETTAKQLMALVESGKLVLMGTYMGCKLDSRSYVSQKTGQKMPLKLAAHVVLVGDETSTRSILIDEVLPDDSDMSKYVAPAKRGESVLVLCAQIKEERGNVTVRPEKMGILKAA